MTVAERGGELTSVVLAFVKELVVLAEYSTHEDGLSLDASSSVATLHIRCMRVPSVLLRTLVLPARRKVRASLFSLDGGVPGQCDGGSSLHRNVRVHIACRWQR